MNSWLNYHHLYYFKMIATEGSISKAAEKLSLGQPTLSAQLKQFEDTLGVPLFDRQHKKLMLTEQGRRALEYANEIFAMGNEMLEVLQDRPTNQRLHVSIGALDSVPKSLILQVLQTAQTYGEASFSILEGQGDEMLRELALHRIDLFISDYAPSSLDIPGLHSKKMAKAPVAAYASPKFKPLKKTFPDSLDGAPLILPTAAHSQLRHDIERYFKQRKWTMDVVVETQDTSLQKLMGAEALGIILAPSFAVDDLLKRKELVELGILEGIYEEFFLVSASRKIANPIAAKLIAERWKI
ncbi:Transcriptional activator protein NhaR [compost metagenome]